MTPGDVDLPHPSPPWRSPSRHRGDAAAADKALLEEPLSSSEVAQLAKWLAEQCHASGRAGHELVDQQQVSVFLPAWERLLARWAPQLTLPGSSLTRQDVFDIADTTKDTWVPLLVASYAWGQGANGYGPHRMAQVIDSAGGSALLERRLAQATHILATQGSQAAYRNMRGAITGLGPAFYTKFLYFVGHARPPHTGPAPLILDARVAAAVRTLATVRNTRAGMEEPAALSRWLWSQGSWTDHRYGVYLEWASRATTALDESVDQWPDRTDLLELALFSNALAGPE